MDLVFGYIAGLLTLINPCVLPVIPIALASATSGHKYGPIALAAGMSVTFSVLGVFVTALGPALGFGPDEVAKIGAVLMITFGLVLLVPKFNALFATATAGMAGRADESIGRMSAGGNDAGLGRQFLGGTLLGAVWSPCIGPTLGGAISLASQGGSLWWAGIIMISFSLGVSTIILALAYGTREAIRSRQQSLKGLAEKSKPIMGVVFVLVGLMILMDWNKYIDVLLLDAMPIWLQDLSVSI